MRHKRLWKKADAPAQGRCEQHGFPVFEDPDGANFGVVGLFHGLKLTGPLAQSEISSDRGVLEVGDDVLDRVAEFSRARSDAVQVFEGSRNTVLGDEVTESYIAGELQGRMPHTCATAYYCEWFLPHMWHYLDPTGKTLERINKLTQEEVQRTSKESDAQLAQHVQVGEAAQSHAEVREKYREFIKDSTAQTMGEDAAEAHMGFRSFEMLYAARRISRMIGGPVNMYCGVHHMWDIEDVAGDAGFEERYLGGTVPRLADCHRQVVAPFYDRVERQFNANRDMYPEDQHTHFLQWLLAQRASYAIAEYVVDTEERKARSAQAAAELGLLIGRGQPTTPSRSVKDKKNKRKKLMKQRKRKHAHQPPEQPQQTIDPRMIPLMREALLKPVRPGDFAQVAGREWSD